MTTMKRVNIAGMLSVLAAVLLLSGCVTLNPDEHVERSDPVNYDQAMNMIAVEMRRIDRNMIGEVYSQAVPQTRRVLQYVESLGRFEPPRMASSYEDYREFGEQVDDLRRATDRLLYMLEQRRRDQARDQLVDVATRYNRLSVHYGPNRQIEVLEQSPDPFRITERYRSEVPGELRGR
jgi:hypothetical protein